MSSVFFLGVGGTLMGSLAILAKQAGYSVSGCDERIYPPMSTQLQKAGLRPHEGFRPELLSPEPDVVVIGNAQQPRGSAGVEHVLSHRMNYTSGAEWLGTSILRGRDVVGIAGTHGKTTTASMVAWILHEAGVAPGFLIGGVPKNFDESARLGTGPCFVVEADEYDTSYFDRRSKFLHYRPNTLVLNNLEYDHADIFEDLEAIKVQVQHLVRTVPANGRIIVPFQHAEIENTLARGCWSPLTYVAIDPSEDALKGLSGTDDHWIAHTSSDEDTRFEVWHGRERIGDVSWEQQGTHNVNNAVFAVAAAHAVGVEPHISLGALRSFQGVKRRMEVIASTENMTIYDDFAHHPTEIRATLQGLRQRVGDDEILAVIDPRTHTMALGTLRKELRECVAAADRVIWYQSQKVQWDLAELVENSMVPAVVEAHLDNLVNEICSEPGSACHVVLMSNGSFGGIYERIETRLHDATKSS